VTVDAREWDQNSLEAACILVCCEWRLYIQLSSCHVAWWNLF